MEEEITDKWDPEHRQDWNDEDGQVDELVMPTAWLHTLDSTDGIPENKPQRELSFSPVHPFGEPGIDYSEEYQITTEPLYQKA